MYIISRFVLATQYVLVYCYARVKRYHNQSQFVFQIASLCTSGGMWLVSYILEANSESNRQVAAKFVLWYGGILLEVAAPFISILFGCRLTGFENTKLTERFSTLTLLILGEGVVGFAVALQQSTFVFIESLMPSCRRNWVRFP